MEWVRRHRIVPAEGMKLQKLEHLAQRLSWLPPRSVCVCVCVCVCVHLAQRLSWLPPRSMCVCVLKGGRKVKKLCLPMEVPMITGAGQENCPEKDSCLLVPTCCCYISSAAPTHTLFTDGRSESILLLPALTGSGGLHLTTAPGDSERL